MRISFVIPAHNEEARIKACLDSIQKEVLRAEGARELNPGDSEIVVVNNLSTDRTREIASSFSGVKVMDERHKGLVWARQGGFNASVGELVANIDADVLVPEGWLSAVLHEFNNNQKLVALSGPFIYYDIAWHSRAMVRAFYWLAYLSYIINRFVLHIGSMLQGGNFVIKREAMERAGGYDTSISFYGEDTDVARRLNKIGSVKWTFGLPVYTSGRRFEAEGIVRTSAVYTANYLSVTFFGKPFTHKYKDVRPDARR